MNLFILNDDPILAAQQQCDKHVVKMIIESAQMLSTTHRMVDGKMERRPSKGGSMLQYFYHGDKEKEMTLYKACHFNHPCTIWTRENTANYNWHYKHFIALCDEYTHRYGKTHATDIKLRQALKTPPNNMIRSNKRTPFRLAMASNPECMFEDVVKSYRAFYHTKQKRFSMTWTKRDIPEWWNATEVT